MAGGPGLSLAGEFPRKKIIATEFGRLTADVEADGGDGDDGREGDSGVEHGQSQDEGEADHGPHRIDGRACQRIHAGPQLVARHTAIARERPQHPAHHNSLLAQALL